MPIGRIIRHLRQPRMGFGGFGGEFAPLETDSRAIAANDGGRNAADDPIGERSIGGFQVDGGPLELADP